MEFRTVIIYAAAVCSVFGKIEDTSGDAAPPPADTLPSNLVPPPINQPADLAPPPVDSGDPGYDLVPPPENGGAPPPVDGGAPPPENGGAPPAENGGVPPPENGGAPPPENGRAPPPENGRAPPPEHGGAPPPEHGGAPPPENPGEAPPDMSGLGGVLGIPPPLEVDLIGSHGSIVGMDLSNYCKRRMTIGFVAMVLSSYPPPSAYASFNMNSTTGTGWLDTWQPDGLCFRVEFVLVVLPDETSDLLAIYDSKVINQLYHAHFLMGEDMSSVRRWAWENRKSYTVSTPLPLFHEQMTDDTIVNIWPSPTVFISSIALNARLLLSNIPHQKILVLTYGETVNLIDYVDRIRRRLQADNNARTVEVFALSEQLSTVEGTMPLADQIYENLAKVRRRMVDVNLVIVYFEAPSEKKIDVLRLLFRKGADLEREDLPWLIADMRFPYEPNALESFETVSALKSPVYMLWPDMGTDYSMMTFDMDCMRPPGIGVNLQGILRNKYFVEKVYTNMTKNFTTKTLLQRLDKLMVLSHTQESGTLDVPQYPRNVLIRMMQMKPMGRVVQELSRRPNADVETLRKCGALKSVFGLKQTLNQYSSKGDIEEYDKGVLRDENYWLMGISARGFDADEGPPLAVMIEDAPFVEKKSDVTYVGIAAELFQAAVQEMTREGIIMRFGYVDSPSYGTKEGDKWSGVFGLLNERKAAKVAVGQISRTSERMAEFDFTEPFGYSYRTYIMKKSLLHEHYSFVRPFTAEVWGYLLLVMVASAIVIHFFDQWNAFKDEIPEGGEFTAGESLWHSFLILTQQGAPFGCHLYPSRIFSMFYWFFSLVVVGCYTGNLASFLTTSQYAAVNIDIAELLGDSDVPYGMVGNTTVEDMFRTNLLGMPLDYLDEAENQGYVFRNYAEGLERVREDGLVLFGTSSVLKYHANNDEECALAMKPRTFYSRDFEELAFAIKPDWEYKDAFKRAMGRVKESGMLNAIYAKWLNFAAECNVEEDDHASMGVSSFYGLITFLAVSIIASYFVLAFKLFYFKEKDDLYLPEVFKNELRAELGLSHRPAEECTNSARKRRNKFLRGKDHRKHSPLIKENGTNGDANHRLSVLSDRPEMNGTIDFSQAPNAETEDLPSEDIDLDDFKEDFV